MRPTVAFATTAKWAHVSLSLESKKNSLIRLHSSTDLSTLVYTRLVTRLYSSILFYIRPHSSVTRLHLSPLVYTCLVTHLCF